MTRPTLGAVAVTGGVSVATLALVVGLLSAWARCTELPRAEVAAWAHRSSLGIPLPRPEIWCLVVAPEGHLAMALVVRNAGEA